MESGPPAPYDPPPYQPPAYQPPAYGTPYGPPPYGAGAYTYPPPAQGEAPQERSRRGGGAAGGAGAAAGLLALLAKSKFLLLLFKFPLAWSMLLTVGLYTLIFGLWAAVGIVLLLLVHEMGHVYELRRQGIPATLPMFIPFMGAFIAMRGNPRDAITEARVGLAGPIAGTAASLVPLALYYSTGSELMLFLAYFGFFINLFNLLPVSPLDGGRALSALSIWFNAVGLVLAALLVLAFGFFSFIFVLIIGLGFFSLLGRIRARRVNPEYYRTPLTSRLAIAAVYFGLVAFLGVAQAATFAQLPHHAASAGLFGQSQ